MLNLLLNTWETKGKLKPYRAFFIFIIILIIISACTPVGIEAEITLTNTPVVTLTETETFTAMPTAIPQLTEELTNLDFTFPENFASFMDQFALGEINETNGYLLRCVFNTADIEYGDITLPGGLEMRAWVKCFFKNADGKTDYVILPIYLVDLNKNQDVVTIFSKVEDLPGGSGFTSQALPKVLPRLITTLTGTDQPKKTIVGISFGPDLSNADPDNAFYAPIMDSITDEAVDAFAQTGNTSLLPKTEAIGKILAGYIVKDMMKQ